MVKKKNPVKHWHVMCFPCINMYFTTIFTHILDQENIPKVGLHSLLRFWHLFPPWMQPLWSVWALSFLPPVTSSINAKLWQARPYGLSLTEDMTAKLFLVETNTFIIS